MAKKIRTKEDRIIELLGAVCEKLDKVLEAVAKDGWNYERPQVEPRADPSNMQIKYGPVAGMGRSED
jgi:hypothetical protein